MVHRIGKYGYSKPLFHNNNLMEDNIIHIELDDEFIEENEVIEVPKEKTIEEVIEEKIVDKLEEKVAEIPKPKDWKEWPKGKDWKTPTKTEIKAIVKQVVPTAKEIADIVLPKIPKPKDGKDWEKWEIFRFSDLTPYEKQVLTWPQGSNGVWVPRGGTTGQKLIKTSSKDFDTEWTNDSGGSTWGSITGTLSDQTDLQTSLDSKIDWTLTATRIPFASAPSTLTDKANFDYISATNILNSFLTETERLTNPNFTGNATWWTVNSWWAYNSNAVYHSSNGASTLSQTPTIYNWGYYKLTIVAANPQSGSWVGTITVVCGGVSVGTISSAGTYTYYVLATNNSGFSLTPSNTGRFGVDSVSLVELSAGAVRTGNLYANELVIAGNKSNYTPGTTRHISLKNQGSNTWIDTYFWNTAWPVLWFSSSGQIEYRATGGWQHVFYNSSSASLYIAQVWTLVYGYLGTQNGVNAGSTSSPNTRLQVNGSAGYSWEYVSSETTLTSSSPKYLITNADEGSSCGGSPSNACSTYTNQTDCELRNSHGWCGWSVVFSCGGSNATFSSCWGDNSTPNTCYDQPDEWSCLSASCYWNGSSCEGDNGTPNTCPDQYDEYSCSGAGCTPDMTPNTCPDYTDYDSCYNAGCTPWETGSCAGTPVCSNVPIGECASEAWCSITGGLSITMPNDNLYGGTSYFQTFFIRNKGTTYNTTLYPNPSSSGQTINGTTSVVLWPWESGHFAFHYITRSCSTWNGDATACGGKSGCSYTSCSGLDETACGEAGGVCSWDTEYFTCNGTGNCNGTNTVMKDWASYPCTF